MGLHHVPLFLFIILVSPLQTRQDPPPITVERCQHANVCLECNCSEEANELKWQKDYTSIYSENSINQSNKYAHRIKTYRNCSLLLENVTEEDGGNYTCRFMDKGKYSYTHVTLKVITNSKKCRDHGTTQHVKDTPKDPPETYFAFLITIPAVLLFGCILIVLRKRKNQPPYKQPVGGHDCLGSPDLPEINNCYLDLELKSSHTV